MRRVPVRLLALGCLVLGACDTDRPEPAACGPDEDRIVVGECFLGLTAYSDSADVVARLGSPGPFGYSSGHDLGLRYFRYDGHPLLGNGNVGFTDRGVYEVALGDGAGARTAEGIGLGSERAGVRRAYGEPNTASGDVGEAGFDFYDSPPDSVSFRFYYVLEAGVPTVRGMSMRSKRDVLVTPG